LLADVTPTFHDFFGDDLRLNYAGAVMIWLFLYFINELAYASQFQILLRGWLHDPAHLYTLKQDMFGLCYGGEPVVVYFFVFLAVEAIYLLQVEFYQRGEQSFREL